MGLRRLLDGTEHAVVLDGATAHLLAHAGLRDDAPLPLSTAAYTAPEQAAGKGADERSDLYSVGVLLFQLLSGRLPVTGATAEELLRAHREERALRLCDIGRRVHPELEDLLARLMAKNPEHRLESGDEAAVMLRALAAMADAAPVEDAPEEEDDPIPVIGPEGWDAPPPQMLPQVDPALERAMLGDVPAAPEEQPPGIPRWATFVAPRWWPVAAAALITVTIGTALLARGRTRAPPALVAESALAPAPPAAQPEAAPAVPAGQPAPALQGDPADAEPPRPNKVAQNAQSPWAKNFERAQKALWTNRPGGAQTILTDILRKPGLSRRDRARASKMMGDALAKKGNRVAAEQWWRKSFQLYDDPEDRARVARLIQRDR